MCNIRPEKSDPNRTRITIGGNRICYPGNVSTKMAPLGLTKMVINIVLYCRRAKFCTFDISNLYLYMPLNCPKNVCVRLTDISQEFIAEYNLTHHIRDGWVYFGIRKRVYGLPQSGILANKILEERLGLAGY